MSLKIGGHLFTGPEPVERTRIAANKAPAVFAVIAKEGLAWDPRFRVIAVGETGETGEAGLDFSVHPQREQWSKDAGDAPLCLYLLDMPRDQFTAAERKELVEAVRRKYDPPLGYVSIGGGV